MGLLYYDHIDRPIRIDDRTLLHLKAVIAAKLRRGESFTLSWRHGGDDAPGRSTIWMHPAICLRFEFEEDEPAPLNRRWLQELSDSANSSGGLVVVEEPVAAGQRPAPGP